MNRIEKIALKRYPVQMVQNRLGYEDINLELRLVYTEGYKRCHETVKELKKDIKDLHNDLIKLQWKIFLSNLK